MYKISLILGGIRSGKSFFAEKTALKYTIKKPYYIATAICFDEEMRERADIHIQRRTNQFITIEEPYDLVKVLEALVDETVLIDCMTLNLSNRMLQNEEKPLSYHIKDSDTYVSELCNTIKNNKLRVYLVSNEVGTSPVSPNKLGRYFQDIQGRWNNILAQNANEVYMLEVGIPRLLKKTPARKFKIGAPSYLIPADYIQNVLTMMNKVDDIQILLFDTPEDDPLFKDETLFTLRYLKDGGTFTYSAHMPTRDIKSEYDKHLSNTLYILDKLSTLSIRFFTFHYDIPKGLDISITENKAELDSIYIRFFKEIKKHHPEIVITLENTTTTLPELDTVVQKANISYCCDIGHYLHAGHPLVDIKERLNKTAVIHIHGLKDTETGSKDHEAVSFNKEVFEILSNFESLVTIENYHLNTYEQSLNLINKYF